MGQNFRSRLHELDARLLKGLKKFWYTAIMIAAMIIGWGSVIISVVIVFTQVTNWLKIAVWEPYTIANALQDLGVPLPYTPRLLGVQKIIDELLTWSAIVGYAAITVAALLVFAWAIVGWERIERDERLAKEAKERAIPRADFDFTAELERALGKRTEE